MQETDWDNQIEDTTFLRHSVHISLQVAAEADEEDDDGVAELRERIAAYNFDSSPDRTEGKLKGIFEIEKIVFQISQ